MRTVNRTDIGKRIRGLRDSRRITREEFSEALDITPQFLRDIEAGTKGMSNETLIKIANYFSVTTDYILFSDAPDQDDYIFMDLIHQCPESKRKHLKIIIEQFVYSAVS